MSEIKPLTIPSTTVKKLRNIAGKFSKLNTGSTSDEFWLASSTGGGGYDWSQYDIGINKTKQLITCSQSGCSCNGEEQPTSDGCGTDLKGAIELDMQDSYYEPQEALAELIEVTNTLYKVLNDKSVSPKEIIGLPNAEVRRAVVELIGYDKIVSEAQVLDESETDGTLLKIPLQEDEDIVLVHVKDPSTTREYFLRVPPNMKTAKRARAWTFGFTEGDFNPKIER